MHTMSSIKIRNLFGDIKVLDFTWAGTGPRTTKYLAEYGAQVVKIESHLRPDVLRTLPPYKDDEVGINRSQTFAKHNNNKLSMALNLNHPRASEVIQKLVLWADIICESFTPGTLARWGLNYEEVRKIKPSIIMMSTSMQGQTGPASKHQGFGTPLTSLSGFNYITGWPDRPPSGVYGPFTDFVAPLFNILGILAALDYHHRTGKGIYLDLSQNECAIHFLSPIILNYQANGQEFQRRGNKSFRFAPHGIYPCKGEDRWCAIAVRNEAEWESFCQVLGYPTWVYAPDFTTTDKRITNSQELDELVGQWTITHSAEDVMCLMQGAGVPAGVVQTGEDLLKDPQLRHYQAFPVVHHPEIGECTCLRSCLQLTKMPACEITPPPLLGEHTEYVCRQLINMPDEEYISLLLDNVFE